MTEGLLGAAYVEVLPRLDRFGPDLNRQLRSNLGSSTFAPLEGAAANAGKLAGKQSGGFFAKHFSSAVHAAKIGAGLAVALGIGTVLRTGFAEAKQAAAGQAQLAAGIRSTHNAARVTIPELEALATRVQNYSGQTDDSIVATEKLLLTFTNIRDGTGKTNKIFTQTVEVAADMAAKMGGDASGAAIQLGKALNDPVKGLSALSRVGVSFDEGQKKRIKRFVEEGNVVAAQKVELRELNKEFGGSAKAAGEVLPGKIEILKRKFEDFSQSIVAKVIPPVLDFIDGLTGTGKAGDGFTQAGREVAKAWRDQVLPALKAVGGVVKSVGGFFLAHRTLLYTVIGAYAALKVALAIGGAVNRAKDALGGLGLVLGRRGAAGAGGGAGLLGALGSIGPVGAGVAAAAGVIGYGFFKAKRDAAEFKAKIENLTGALNEQTGALTKGARAQVAHNLEQTGALKTAQKYAFDLSDVTSAALGNAAATKRITDRVLELVHAHKMDKIEAINLLHSIGASTDAIDKQRSAIQRTSAATNDWRKHVRDLNQALKDIAAHPFEARLKFTTTGQGPAGTPLAPGAVPRGSGADPFKPHYLGQAFGASLAGGMAGQSTLVYTSAHSLAAMAEKGAKDALGIHSPSRVGEGIALNFGVSVGGGLDKAGPAVGAAAVRLAEKMVTALKTRLTTLRSDRAALVSALTSGLSGGADLSGLTIGKGPAGTTRVGQTQGFLANFAAKLKTFVRLLVRTRRLGLMPGLLDQIAQLGPDQGIPILRDIDAGGRAGIQGINASERQILTLSKSYATGQGTFEFGGKIDAINKRLDRLHDDLEGMRKELKKHPEKTGQHVGDALNGTAQRAHLAARGRVP